MRISRRELAKTSATRIGLGLPIATAWLLFIDELWIAVGLAFATVVFFIAVYSHFLRSESLELANFPDLPKKRREVFKHVRPLASFGFVLSTINSVVFFVFDSTALNISLAFLSAFVSVGALIDGALVFVDRERLWRMLRELSPEILLPYRGKLAKTHLMYWVTLLRSFPWSFVVVTDLRLSFDLTTENSDFPIVYTAGSYDLSRIFAGSAKVALYGHNARENDRFLKFKKVTHVFLGHGESDKPGSSSELIKRYDLVFAAGPANMQRLHAAGIDIPRDSFRFIGRPQTAGIEFVSHPSALSANPIVLYTQTWPRDDGVPHLSSIEFGEKIVATLLSRGAVVYFRPHAARRGRPEWSPFVQRTNALLEADHVATGRPHRWGPPAIAHPLHELMNMCDVLISDVSGVVGDFIATNKPYAIVGIDPVDKNYEGDFVDRFRSQNFTAAPATIIKGDLSNIDAALDELFGPDIHFEERLRTRELVLSGLHGEKAKQVFQEELAALINKK